MQKAIFNNIYYSRLILIFLIGLPFVSCKKEVNRINGRVVENGTNIPVSRATVVLSAPDFYGTPGGNYAIDFDTTNENGEYEFVNPDFINRQDLTLIVFKEGYKPADPLEPTIDGSPLNFFLFPYGKLLVHIKCTDNNLQLQDYISIDRVWGDDEKRFYGPNIDTTIVYNDAVTHAPLSLYYSTSIGGQINYNASPSFEVIGHKTQSLEIKYP